MRRYPANQVMTLAVWLAAVAGLGGETLIEKAYVNEERGWAGRWPGKSEYAFQIRELPQAATVIFWGAGDFGKDSEGDVYLCGPDFREKIATWDKSKFNKTAFEAATYQDLNPIAVDVSRLVTKPGVYTVQFVYRSGKYQFDILRVEIRIKMAVASNRHHHRDRDGDRFGRKIYESTAAGIAGALRDNGNIYTFANMPACRRATLCFWAQVSGAADTCGDVFLQRPDGERALVYRWRAGEFQGSRSGNEAQPSATVDVSSQMSQPGIYKILFLHRTGSGFIAIARVQLICEESGQTAGMAEFRVYNDDPVINNPRRPAMFTLETEAVVSYIETNHWNAGRGAMPGHIALRHSDGTLYGPWRANGLHGQDGRQNIAWMAMPNQRLKAGTYTVIDSDPATWACNARSNYVGFVTVIFSPVSR